MKKMKKLNPKQTKIEVKSAIAGIFRDLNDKKIPHKFNPVRNDILDSLRVADRYVDRIAFARDAQAKLAKLNRFMAKKPSVDRIEAACKKDWPEISQKIFG